MPQNTLQLARDLNVTSDEAFCRLPESVREQFAAISEVLPTLIAAKKLRSACCEVVGRIPNITWKALYARVLAFKRSGNWHDLVERRKCPSLWETKVAEAIGLPLAFTEFVKARCEKDSRTDRGGIQEVYQIWRTHLDSEGKYYDAIPGYLTWPDAEYPNDLPKGWSERNLRRWCAPDEFDETASRIGMHAAAQFRPSVPSTRYGLRLGERVEFDDHEYNLKVLFAGQTKAMRPRGFTAADTLSGFLVPSFKPTLWDVDEEKKKALNERDFLWFVVHWLTCIGYRNDDKGTEFVVEHGTAAIRKDFEKRIAIATNDKVRVARGGRFGTPAHGGLFEHAEPKHGRGNFHFKAIVESAFNLIDNKFARLPAQTGKDRNHFPDDTVGRERYLKQVLAQMEKLPADRAVEMALPVLTWSQFANRAVDLYREINENTDHNLEGWEKLGFETIDWRLGENMPWMPQADLLAMPPEERVIANGLLRRNDHLTNPRKLSRAEVWQAHKHELTRLPMSCFAMLVGIEHGKDVVVNNRSEIEIKDREISREPLTFLAADFRTHQQFAPGEQFLGFVNPFDPRWMQITKANGEHVAICPAWEPACKTDEEGVQANQGKQKQWLANRQARRDRRHESDALARQDLIQHNDDVAQGKAVTAEQKHQAKTDDDLRALAEAALDRSNKL